MGGKDHYPVDATVGDQVTFLSPSIPRRRPRRPPLPGAARSSTCRDRGPAQFLDIGTALCPPPTTPTRSPSASPPPPASCTRTTTRWSSPTPVPS
ncbi:SAM-dependent methyltransferase [Streptomyces cremeus]|uniref:SAM-dependent methyltransferase n=1 Tax=Streptomyces cremeus TaxID=66881 RepID=UPI0031F0DAAF